MRVFLRSARSGRYYGDSGQVDAEPNKALEFPSVQAAMKHALSAKLTEVKVALRCDYLSQEVLLPVLPEWHDHFEQQRQRLAA